jgi:hypothetical protein
MSRWSQRVFGLLVVLQTAHSVEEYATGLYRVLAPARFVSSLVSDDLAVGFAVVNAALVALGLWCYLAPIRSGWPTARAWAWGWAVVEIANGAGHVALGLATRGYFPGLVTAPLLVATGIGLAVLLRRDARES